MIWNAVVTVISLVLASILVILLSPMSEAVEFLVFAIVFFASAWLLDRVLGRRFRSPRTRRSPPRTRR